jgi:hypothetical protein
MDLVARTTFAVRPAAALAARPRLFGALAAAFPVAFRPWAPDAEAEAVIVIADDPGGVAVEELALDRRPALVLAGGATDGARPLETLEFADVPAVDPRLRGVVLEYRGACPALRPDLDRDDVLAAARSGPVWTRSRGAAPVQVVRTQLPELTADERLPALIWQHTLAAVALVHFLRSPSADPPRPSRPVRASFVFDDPNLRRPSYGFIDYRRLVEHADEHGYHAAMAMIPLDAGRPHESAAALFKRRRDRLSLVVHGNDHVKRELLRPRDPHGALASAAQAIRRIERFERRWGLAVDRVMMPPHGMCSETVARALAAVGFDALCTIHPIPWTGHPPATELLAGWNPAEFVGGCAVLPRVRLAASPGEIALRAFLDHPIVIYGHHDDLANGLESLAEAAARVNRIAGVRWSSVGEIALGNASTRVDGDRLVVRPYARRIQIDPPDGAKAISVTAPQQSGAHAQMRGWSVEAGLVHPFGADVPLVDSRSLLVRLRGADDVDPGRVAAPAWRPWPKLRRAGTELRDRAMPLRPPRAR